jgi:large repetitive protein
VVGTVTLSNGDVLTYTVGNLTPGQSVTQTFTTTLSASTVTSALNATSTVATSTPETDSTNNTGTASMSIGTPPATISGRVYSDQDRNRVYSPGTDQLLPGYVVELLRVTGTSTVVVGSTTSAANGQYSITSLVPGTGYQLRFKSPQGNVILGTPFNQSATTMAGNPSTGTNSLTAAVSPSQTVTVAGLIDNITLYSGDNTVEQNLPLDPSGVIYDSVTRAPLGGATVTLNGPPGFNPATHLVAGTNVFVTDATTGGYQFLFTGTPPSGPYTLVVTPPANYAGPNAVMGGVAAPSGTLNVPAGITNVQPQTTAPAVGVVGNPGTTYYLSLNFNFATPGEVFNNHIPLDPISRGALLVSKVGDKTVAELGDSIRYTIRLTNTSGSSVAPVRVEDSLPAGFRYIPGTSRLGGVALADPAGGTGRSLVFTLPAGVAAGTTAELSYFVRLGVGSQQGDGINRAVGVFDGPSGPVRSNVATFKVKVQGGVFSNEGCIVGKVYTDCDGDHMQDNASGSRELGIPGIRLVMLNGSYVITDGEGKYSMCGLKSQTHVLKVDRTTLPKGALLLPSSNRNAGDGGSIFVDMKGGELSRADFIVGSCTTGVLDQIKARRAQGGGVRPETEKGLDFKILPGGESPRQQILPAPRQDGDNVSVQGGIAK